MDGGDVRTSVKGNKRCVLVLANAAVHSLETAMLRVTGANFDRDTARGGSQQPPLAPVASSSWKRTLLHTLEGSSNQQLGQDCVCVCARACVGACVRACARGCRGVLHRDVKPANMLIARRSQRIKLGDFGISKILQTTARARTVVGTPYYLAPEMVSGQVHELDAMYPQHSSERSIG
eukprot:6489085-Amphidinium_carterae.2